MRSLQGKIILAYLALAALAVGLLLIALVELNLITGKVRAGSQVAEFFDATLEIRRFEKNHFLYGQPRDLAENTRYTAHAQNLLLRNGPMFASLAGAGVAQALSRDLAEYERLMAGYARTPADERLAGAVRSLGKRIVTAAEGLAARERQSLHDALDTHRHNLLISVAVVLGLLVLTGMLLAIRVARPLKAMETRMEAIAQGRLDRLPADFSERELIGLTEAFNRVLDELERRQHTLVRAEKLASLGTLLSGVAHELNNPLSNISTSAQILNQAGETDPEFRRELLADIDQETRRAAKIVRSLLDYARDRDFSSQPVKLAELLDETLRFLKSQRPPGIEVSLDIPADLAVAADRPRLQQAFLNLIGNALEAMGDYGELRIAARRGVAGSGTEGVFPALLGTCRPGTQVVDITFADSGPGIPAALLPRVFDPFFTTKPIGQGNGLGLFIVHEIIEEHGGCIGVANPPDGGACFHIRLPLDNLAKETEKP
ncbi:MAG: HAMP domain-containing protein [Hydrogenophilales bacterium]|nr:HAMP domain-containing protein [Hydrogenophilales bacterium]